VKSFPLPSILFIEEGKIVQKLNGINISTADMILFYWNQFKTRRSFNPQDVLKSRSFNPKTVRDRIDERNTARYEKKNDAQNNNRIDNYYFDKADGVIKFNTDDKQDPEEKYLIVE
jgi:hypothetical protein